MTIQTIRKNRLATEYMAALRGEVRVINRGNPTEMEKARRKTIRTEARYLAARRAANGQGENLP